MSRVKEGERAREDLEGGDEDGSGGRAKQICSMREKERQGEGGVGGQRRET